jgi:hypothetical protein
MVCKKRCLRGKIVTFGDGYKFKICQAIQCEIDAKNGHFLHIKD